MSEVAAAGKRALLVRNCNVALDPSGDVQLQLHHDCGCCTTWAQLRPEQADDLAEILRFAATEGRARKAGAVAELDGGQA